MEPTTINDLILTLKGNRTYEQLSEDCGGVPTAGRIQQLATREQNTFPSPDTVRGLAKGLHTNTRAILNACGHSLGLLDDAPSSRLVTMLPPGVEALDDGQLAAVLAVVNQFTACNIHHRKLSEYASTDHSVSEEARKRVSRTGKTRPAVAEQP